MTQDPSSATPPAKVDLYNNVYSDFASNAEAQVRQAAFGEDIGQSSWTTAAEWLRFADQAQVGKGSHVLEVGSGSGGPAIYLATKRDCRVTGVDLNPLGVANGERLAAARGVGDRVSFRVVDAREPLPFPDAGFDAVLSNDVMAHIVNRLDVLRDWHRLLRPGGRMLFSDAMVVTGAVSNAELAARSSIGSYLFVPPGENERFIEAAGFRLLGVEDLTLGAARVAKDWRDAREHHHPELVAREGEGNFAGLQQFLTAAHELAASRRLSRFSYLAEKND